MEKKAMVPYAKNLKTLIYVERKMLDYETL